MVRFRAGNSTRVLPPRDRRKQTTAREHHKIIRIVERSEEQTEGEAES